jgi:uncharacterized protein YkwD
MASTVNPTSTVDMSVLNTMTEDQLQQHVRELKPEQIHSVSAENIKLAMAAVTPQQVQTILTTLKKDFDISQLVSGLTEAQLKAAVESINDATKKAATEALELDKEENQKQILSGLSESKRKIITPTA